MVLNDPGSKGDAIVASALQTGIIPSKEAIYMAKSTVTSAMDPHTKSYSHINGTVEQLLDRIAVSELCKGWPVYRDASEWGNYRSLFTEDGTVWTSKFSFLLPPSPSFHHALFSFHFFGRILALTKSTAWSGPQPVDEFIAVSKAGKEKGVFIMHRECGTLAELGSTPTPDGVRRAIGKMKATITHRFTFPESQFDVDCDCRFIFFCEKAADDPNAEWKAKYVKLFYEKDKVVPVDGYTAPRFEAAELDKYPKGYCFLGAAQARLGYEIDIHLPTPFDSALWDRMYGEMEKWLDGKKVDLFWE